MLRNLLTTFYKIFLQYLFKHRDSGNVAFYLFFDFRKAFDCVSHEIIISNREQYGCINNVNSNHKTIQCGVPQGSIYLNTLFTWMIACFQLVYQVILLWILNKLIMNLNIFTDGWNEIKLASTQMKPCTYMLFSYNKNVNFSIIKICSNNINETSGTKFLGIHLDKKLNFVNHVTEISKKIAKSIGLLHKLNRFLPETILKTSYTSLIDPYLSYRVEQHHSIFFIVELLRQSSTVHRTPLKI